MFSNLSQEILWQRTIILIHDTKRCVFAWLYILIILKVSKEKIWHQTSRPQEVDVIINLLSQMNVKHKFFKIFPIIQASLLTFNVSVLNIWHMSGYENLWPNRKRTLSYLCSGWTLGCTRHLSVLSWVPVHLTLIYTVLIYWHSFICSIWFLWPDRLQNNSGIVLEKLTCACYNICWQCSLHPSH